MATPPNPRILIIGAGSRGRAYARAITHYTSGTIVGVAEPLTYKREFFCSTYSIPPTSPLILSSWVDLLSFPHLRSHIDGIAICTLDDTHTEILLTLLPLNLHILCEKPLATNLTDIRRLSTAFSTYPALFAIGHVLRYSPHNRLLYTLLPQLGEIYTIHHTEPVGYWHFAHSYVRGNWRREETSAPSLLTKCCHDVDLLMWFLSYPMTGFREETHMPARVSSHGQLTHFRRRGKPEEAGEATNCFSCNAEPRCIYSAKRVYIDHKLKRGNRGWPVKIVLPEIEDASVSLEDAESRLVEELKKDYGAERQAGDEKSYYGRCVYESDNDVLDHQTVVLSFPDTPQAPAKTATLQMVAYSHLICERQTKIYGSKGEITADGKVITLIDFSGQRKVYTPEQYTDSHHGGGDQGLAMAWVGGMQRCMRGEEVERVQREELGVSVEEICRSHEVVFWAEEARKGNKVLGWEEWQARLHAVESPKV